MLVALTAASIGGCPIGLRLFGLQLLFLLFQFLVVSANSFLTFIGGQLLVVLADEFVSGNRLLILFRLVVEERRPRPGADKDSRGGRDSK